MDTQVTRAPVPARGSAAVRSGQALAVAGALAPTLAVFVAKALTPLFFLVALVEIGLFWRDHRRLPPLPFVPSILFAAFVGWGFVGILWSLDGLASLHTASKLTIMAVFGLPLIGVARGLSSEMRDIVLRFLVGGLVCGLVFMAVEVLGDMPLTTVIYAVIGRTAPIYKSMLNQAATTDVILGVIAATVLLEQRSLVGAFVVGATAAFLAIVSESMAAGVASILAAIILALVYWRGGSLGRALAIIAAGAIMIAPLLPNNVLGPVKEMHWPKGAIPSVYQRIGIWTFAADRIAERPVLGWGLDAARRIPGGHDGLRIESMNIQDPVMRDRVGAYFRKGNIERMPLHPHNAALQIWLEAGGVGAVLSAGLILAVLLGAARRYPASPFGASAVFAVVITALVIADLSYGIWQTWWLCDMWFGAVFAAILLGEPRIGSTGSEGSQPV